MNKVQHVLKTHNFVHMTTKVKRMSRTLKKTTEQIVWKGLNTAGTATVEYCLTWNF